jgi:MoxR-like ATPase
MAERRVSIDDVTYELPKPFLVVATQNPLESHGTYPLPESQLDRFLMRVTVGYPPREVERKLLIERGGVDPITQIKPIFGPNDLKELMAEVDTVRFDPSLADYVLAIAEATRNTARLSTGVSTRGALALQRAARAYAMVLGRSFVVPDDIKRLAIPVLSHRVSLGTGEAVVGSSRAAAEGVIREILARVEAPV